MLRIVLLVGLIGHLMCIVFGEPPSNWRPYRNSHTPTAEYGPPTTSNPPDTAYGAPSSIQIEPETEYNVQISEINTPLSPSSYVYVASKPLTQFGQLKRASVSALNSFQWFCLGIQDNLK